MLPSAANPLELSVNMQQVYVHQEYYHLVGMTNWVGKWREAAASAM
jgi:hypothetical protein